MDAIILWSAIALVSTAVVWKGSGMLEAASARLSAHYELPDVVQGAMILAVGSSFPELTTAVVSAWIHGEFELGMAAIVGSALFNILVIPGLAGLMSPKPLKANRDLVYKEAQFYMIAVAVLLLTFAFAVIYHPAESPHGMLRGELTRPLVLIPIALYGLYVFVQYHESVEFTAEIEPAEVRPLREFSRLAVSLVLILAGVEGLVRAAINFGDIFDTPSFLWGITLVAAGTSVPDAFVSARAALKGRGVKSIANVLGSNSFDLLVAIPAGVLVAGAAVINFSVAAPLMGVLTAATIVLFVTLRTDMVLSRRESVLLLVCYALFVGWVAAETFQILDLVPGMPPPGPEG